MDLGTAFDSAGGHGVDTLCGDAPVADVHLGLRNAPLQAVVIGLGIEAAERQAALIPGARQIVAQLRRHLPATRPPM